MKYLYLITSVLVLIWSTYMTITPDEPKEKQNNRMSIEHIYKYEGIRIITLDKHQYIEFDKAVIHK